MKNNSNITSIFALGGLGEVGKNMYVVTHNEEIIIIDAGVMFPEDDLLGIDYVIQDVSYLKQNEDKIKGLFITHGHEDHIGGISFLLNSVNIPKIYASKISTDLINKKLIDRNIIRLKFYIMAELGKKGVTLLLSDSTNALSEGFSKSESSVDEALNDIVSKHYGRVIIATFASNIYRIKHIVETCRKNNRKIIVFGRSMETSIELAMNNGLIEDKTIFIDNNEAKNLKKNEICILCTGTQGEPLAALSRIANGVHKQITLMPDDLVVFSSSPIPGNAASINKVINKLYLKGVKVYTNKTFNDVHTSGHAKEEELKWMLRIIKPKYFMPMHGEYRMLKRHTEIAEACGVPKENTFICKNGDGINIKDGIVTRGETIKSGDVYVDGSRIGDVGSQIIKDRKLMSNDGILVTILNINTLTRKLLIKPNVTTRGFIMVNENPELINKIEKKITEIVNNFLSNSTYNYTDLKNQIILELYPFINDLTGRRPIILPVIMEVNQA